MKRRLIVILALGAILIAFALWARFGGSFSYSRIQINMTSEEVIRILGRPDHVDADKCGVWVGLNGDQIRVHALCGRVCYKQYVKYDYWANTNPTMLDKIRFYLAGSPRVKVRD